MPPTSARVAHGALAMEVAGDGPAILLLHGLTATRRYVVHGSTALVRAGYTVIAYDARGHGASDPATDYSYEAMASDALAVLDAAGVTRAALVGQSMGAATAARVALESPDRVAALIAVTPAHRGMPSADLPRWDRLAQGLEQGGPPGFLAALGEPGVAPRYRDAVLAVIGQRLGRHEHPAAVAAALRATPRTTAFDTMAGLADLSCPTLVVGSRDEADPDHPLEVARAWAEAIPGARLVVEEESESPLAWRGGALSQQIVAFLADVPGWAPLS